MVKHDDKGEKGGPIPIDGEGPPADPEKVQDKKGVPDSTLNMVYGAGALAAVLGAGYLIWLILRPEE